MERGSRIFNTNQQPIFQYQPAALRNLKERSPRPTGLPLKRHQGREDTLAYVSITPLPLRYATGLPKSSFGSFGPSPAPTGGAGSVTAYARQPYFQHQPAALRLLKERSPRLGRTPSLAKTYREELSANCRCDYSAALAVGAKRRGSRILLVFLSLRTPLGVWQPYFQYQPAANFSIPTSLTLIEKTIAAALSEPREDILAYASNTPLPLRDATGLPKSSFGSFGPSPAPTGGAGSVTAYARQPYFQYQPAA